MTVAPVSPFQAPKKAISMVALSGEALTADYEPHELEFMRSLRGQLDGPDADAAKNSMLVIHELKGKLPGARLLTAFEADEIGLGPLPDGFYTQKLFAVDDTSEQLEFGQKARATDPVTSHIAAEAVLKTTAGSQREKLWRSFVVSGADLTDEEAAMLASVALTSEYATRCSELRNAGLISETGATKEGGAGVPRIVSRVTALGKDEYARQFGQSGGSDAAV